MEAAGIRNLRRSSERLPRKGERVMKVTWGASAHETRRRREWAVTKSLGGGTKKESCELLFNGEDADPRGRGRY